MENRPFLQFAGGSCVIFSLPSGRPVKRFPESYGHIAAVDKKPAVAFPVNGDGFLHVAGGFLPSFPWFRTTLRWPLPLWTTMIPSGAVPWNQLWKTGSNLRLCAHPAHEGRLSLHLLRGLLRCERKPAHAPRHHRQSAVMILYV